MPKLFDLGMHIDPHKIKIEDLQPGYICKTLQKPEIGLSNVWIYFDIDHVRKLFDDYVYYYGAFVRPNAKVAGKISFISMYSYLKTWPNELEQSKFNVTDIWKSNINLDDICTATDFLNFYELNNLYDL